MTDLALLATVAVLMSATAPTFLVRQRWFERSPRVGLALWLAALWSAMTALVLAVALIALDNAPVREIAAELIRACLLTFHRHYGTHPLAAAIALALLIAAAAALLAQAVMVGLRLGLTRRRHCQTLDIVARADGERGVWVIDHPKPTAYCLAGRRGRIVVSSAAIARLAPDELDAVIAHERAHLSGRHHVLAAVVYAYSKLFPFVPIARAAPYAVGHLLERLADDRACRAHSPRVLASALRAMAPSPTPVLVLGAGGGHSDDRIRHLETSTPPVSATQRAAALLLAAMVVALPLVLAVQPALGLAFADQCTLPPAT